MKPVFLFVLSLLLLISCTLASGSSLYDDKIWYDKVYKDGIKTVLIYKKGWELSMPVINLELNEQIELVFDELGNKKGDYSWSLIHCNMSWEKDNLEPFEYISGYENGDVTEISFSQNTRVNYINYKLNLPSKKTKLIKSGNYIIKINERNNPEKIILTKRFYVIEPFTEIDASVNQLKVNIKDGMNQRLNIKINYNATEISEPVETIAIKILKNQEFEKNISSIKPSAISGNILKYENLDELCFIGGNEYRHFDIKSVKFLSDRLQNIENFNDGIQVYLTPDENRSKIPYNFKNDINGRKTVKLENNYQSNIMADYCFINFSLESEILLEKGDFYVYGAISDWQFDNSYKLTYDSEKKLYTTKLFLKQGYYNYLYLFKSDDEFYSEEEFYRVEGNHFQTENEYNIFIYYKDISSGYDRLVGYHSVKSTLSGDY